MTPAYVSDPAKAAVVAREDWFAAPAKKDGAQWQRMHPNYVLRRIASLPGWIRGSENCVTEDRSGERGG